MNYKELSPKDEVNYLSDLINTTKASDRVNRLNDRKITNHEIALTEFHNNIKETNKIAEMKLKSAIKETLEKTNVNLLKINSTHINAIEKQDNFVSVEQFHDIWNKIKDGIEYNLEEITLMEDYIVKKVEFSHSENIKALATQYFDKIKSNGIWDDLKLNKFLNNEIKLYNLGLISNLRKYSTAVSNVKIYVLSKMADFRKQWEKHLLTWRDFLVNKSLSEVKEIMQSDEYTKSAQIKLWTKDTFSSFNKDDEAILLMYSKIIEGLPYNQEKMLSFSNQIEVILNQKEETKRKYLEKAKAHNDTLIEKLENKLYRMKNFLFEEASCSEEQFLKTFSKYTGNGTESFEFWAKQRLINDNHEMEKSLKTMNSVHSIMMRFFYCIYEVWIENSEKVESLRESLFDEINSCRIQYENEKKLLEYAMDKNTSQVSHLSCTSKLDKSLDKVKISLKAIEQNSEDLHSALIGLVMTYPETCTNQIKGYESKMLLQIGLINHKLNVPANDNISPYCISSSGQAYDRLDKIPSLCFSPEIDDIFHDVQVICEKLYASVCQILIDHIGTNEKNHTEISNVLVLKLKNEMIAEKYLRDDLHKPRLGFISEEFNYRRKELEDFKARFEQFYESSVEFESQMVKIEEDFTKESNDTLSHIELEIETMVNNQLKINKSKILITSHMKFESHFLTLEKKMPSLVKSSLLKIDKDSKSMQLKEDDFFHYASSGHFDFTEKSKYYHEFSEIKERIRQTSIQCKRAIKQIETAKSKKVSGSFQNYKMHYKHCLLDLYFIEFKSMLLASIRTKIRSVTSCGGKDLSDARLLCKQIQQSSIELDNCESKTVISRVVKHKNDFIHVFDKLKTFINFQNYRCSDITLPAQNSFAKLNEKYSQFVNDNASLSETIDFTKDIIQLTSKSYQGHSSVLSDSEMHDGTDNNWIVDRSNVEKKFITGNITCIYGVGASCFDIPNHPWANACATLVSNNSYWLSKNRDGMQALKDLQEKKQASVSKSQTTCSDNTNVEKKSINKMKDRIKMLINKSAQSNSHEKIPENNSPDTLSQDSASSGIDSTRAEDKKHVNFQFSNNSDNEEKGQTKLSILPAINPSMMRNSSRKDSVNQMNLRKVMNLNKTVEYLTKESNKKRRSTYFQQNPKLPVYDFSIMDEKELKEFVFKTAKFFGISVRKYNVDDVCKNIFSIIEKVKCYLLHLQEDFIITCIIFYRQKHLSIKYPKLMHPNSDNEIESFVSQLQLYLESVDADGNKNITKVKELLNKLYDVFEGSSAKIFYNIFSEMIQSYTDFYDLQISKYENTLQKNRLIKEKLVSSLRPDYCHPNHNETLEKICENEQKSRINHELILIFNYSIDRLDEKLCDFESKIKCISENLLEIIQSTIQIRDIRKMESIHENLFEVKKMLHHNLVSTVNGAANIDSQGDHKIKSKNTKDRLTHAVFKDRKVVESDFRNIHKTKTNEFNTLHSSSCAEEDDWIIMWQSQVKNLKGLMNNEM